GGTVGDIESLPYMEAIRQFRRDKGTDNTLVLHLTLIPYLNAAKELKTKPTQHSVKELLMTGIQPDVLICRTEHPLPKEIREKLALFCNVETSAVIEAIDAETIYDVPLLMLKEKLDKIVIKKLNIKSKNEPDLSAWKDFLGKLKNPTKDITIGLVGKYNELPDAYKSIYESFVHAGAVNECKVKIVPIHSENLIEEVGKKLKGLDGILVAPGFGERGIEGKINAIQYVRENNIPFFGICLGMQCAVVEFCKNVVGLDEVASSETNANAKHLVIDLMEEQKKITNKGGTMRLGSYPCKIHKGSLANKIYGKTLIEERHRHRYEFNNDYLAVIEEKGMKASGINPDSNLVEIIEIPQNKFFVGVVINRAKIVFKLSTTYVLYCGV
nr:CTP synthase [Saprospiraceae bacterium]